jgi:Flp pilus assembly protein protease CpaA
MADKIAASIAFVVIFVYLASYAFLLHSIPLWTIIAGVLVMVFVAYIESMKAAQNDENGAG